MRTLTLLTWLSALSQAAWAGPTSPTTGGDIGEIGSIARRVDPRELASSSPYTASASPSPSRTSSILPTIVYCDDEDDLGETSSPVHEYPSMTIEQVSALSTASSPSGTAISSASKPIPQPTPSGSLSQRSDGVPQPSSSYDTPNLSSSAHSPEPSGAVPVYNTPISFDDNGQPLPQSSAATQAAIPSPSTSSTGSERPDDCEDASKTIPQPTEEVSPPQETDECDDPVPAVPTPPLAGSIDDFGDDEDCLEWEDGLLTGGADSAVVGGGGDGSEAGGNHTSGGNGTSGGNECVFGKWQCEGTELQLCGYISLEAVAWIDIDSCPERCELTVSGSVICT